MNQTCRIILDTIDMLLGNSPNTSEGIKTVQELYKNSLEKAKAFSIESVVYGPYMHELLDKEVQENRNRLLFIKGQLLGQEPNARTYALKYHFIELLSLEAFEGYKLLYQLYGIITQKIADPNFQGVPSNYDDLREDLYQLSYQKIHPTTIMELIVIQASHILLSLPDDSHSFDIMDCFSSIYPISSIESVDSQLYYVQKLVNILTGDEVLFVDIYLLLDGNFMIALR